MEMKLHNNIGENKMSKQEIKKKIKYCKSRLDWYAKNVRPEVLADKDDNIHIIIGEYRFHLAMFERMLNE
tara:strand:+ start:1089 stop:1298 length:210 start_codon:yes stop_codon:yes gene_type:complete